eukprot:5110153-Alexandrium_andersonii.AAC.1
MLPVRESFLCAYPLALGARRPARHACAGELRGRPPSNFLFEGRWPPGCRDGFGLPCLPGGGHLERPPGHSS